ncbi:hypothetical protein BKA61DRAFT_608419 [Leptodontidium sp. MPI-SDFR-AT-0119]|nr:hypothetical protein BKA61DRAFT_608419 [Leptodontidium sp. MPI-SDFR-AT-0119]
MNPLTPASLKICASCGRKITWRKKWKKNWDAITYCSDSCRKHKVKHNSIYVAFETKIISLLQDRRAIRGLAAVVTCEEAEKEVLKERKSDTADDTEHHSAVVSPEEADIDPRGPPTPSKTRERCRQAARRLVARGEVVVTQSGKVVDPSFAKGVMELKFPS